MIDSTKYAFNVESSESSESDPFFPIRRYGKWGYINQTGKIVIQPKFLQAGEFLDGIARVALVTSESEIDEIVSSDPKAHFFNRFNRYDHSLGTGRKLKYVFIDKSGEVVLNPGFDFVDHISDGLARVSTGHELYEKWGFIDKEGNVVIEPRFSHAMPFSCERAEVRINYKSGFIDKAGNVVVEPKYSDAYAFSEGLALVRIGIMFDRKYGYVDMNGNMAIKPVFSDALPFSEGLAPANPYGFYEGIWGYIDKSGIFIVKPKYDRAWAFSEGLAFVNRYPLWKIPNIFLRSITEPTKQALINKYGEQITDFIYYNVGRFSEGLCRVSLETEPKDCRDFVFRPGKTGYIDKSGKLKIPYNFDDAHSFHNGLACVRIADKWGYINKSGSIVYHPTS